MAVYSFRVGPYARSIFLYGTTSFPLIPTEYHQPVKQYASDNFTQWQIDEALRKGYISQQEYDETILLIDEPFELPQTAPSMEQI
jgi:hypothetical protein